MPRLVELVRTDDVTVLRSTCDGGEADPEVGLGYELVRVRRGVFRREVDEGVRVVDATAAYVGRPGQWQQIHHVHGCGDATHVVAFSARLIGDDAERLPVLPVRVPPGADLALRAAVGAADALAVEEATARTLAALVDGPAPAKEPEGARLAAVESVRERLAADPAERAGLVELAADVGYAPTHLSRVFAAVTGSTLARHRRALRAHVAAAWIEDGAADLADLAADLGFADHSHLVRALRADVGLTPTRLRQLAALIHA